MNRVKLSFMRFLYLPLFIATSVMNKVKLLWGKISLITVLSLGFMVLGIGCVSWAMSSICAQPDYSIPTTPPGLTAEGVNVKSDPSLVLPAPDKTLYPVYPCLLYTSDAADDLLCVDLGGRRILKKKK